MAKGRSTERTGSGNASSGAEATPASLDKLLELVPPYDEAAEAGVLGAMLISPQAADVALEELIASDFYMPRHRTLFTVLGELFQKTENADELYVCSELERRGLLEEVGGRDYVGRLIFNTPSAAGIEGYCKVVRDRSTERELIDGAGAILRSVREPSASDGSELVEQAEALIYKIAEKRYGEESQHMLGLMSKVLADAERNMALRRNNEEIPTPALPTHYPALDHLLSGGFWPGELIILAGRPSMGKTTFALNIVRQVSVGREDRVRPTAVFSLEMPAEQVAKNILAAEARVAGQKLRRYEFSEEEFDNVKSANIALQAAPIFIDDTSGISLGQLRSRLRRLKQRQNIALAVIDYLQLMKGNPNTKSREQEVAEISRGLKSIARDLEIPIVVLSQLNRSAEKRENDDKRPQLSDLRESGSIEQDADVVIMLYRSEYWDMERNANMVNVGEALVMKNRNGPVGTVKVTFLKDILRFESYVPEQNVAAGE
jgi:replicative DNA helicase